VKQAAGRVTGIEVDGEIIFADAVVIAMGPWSILAAGWLSLPAVYGLKGHSLIFETGMMVPAEALFLEYEETTGEVQAPELFPRPDGTVYVCGISSESPLPIDPAAIIPDPDAIERLTRICNQVSPALASAKNSRSPGVLSPDHPGRSATDRPRAGSGGRLHCHRPQCVGHPQRTGYRRVNGRTDRRRHDARD
jgi:glycine/D-amino acid oxidase-like deaminating enzyme